MVDQKKVKMGKKSKAAGGVFELRVRHNLEEKGWFVDKFTDNVELIKEDATLNPELSKSKGIVKKEFDGGQWVKKMTYGKLIPAKTAFGFNPRLKMRVPLTRSTGFPDFICFKKAYKPIGESTNKVYEIIGVESKMTGNLDRPEKEKCVWLLENNIFSKILIAEKTKVKNRVVIVYHDFKEKYWRFYK